MNYAEERLEICNKCDHLLNGDCILCGCTVEDKVKDPAEKCPMFHSKWGPYVEQDEPIKKEPEQNVTISNSSAPTQNLRRATRTSPCKTCNRKR